MYRRVSFIIIMLLVAVFIGLASYERLAGDDSNPVENARTVVVERGKIAATVNATGVIAPESEAILSFIGSGRINGIFVKEGEAVEVGQVLAKLETNDLELQVAQAEAALKMAEARLEQIRAGARPEEIAAAEAAVRVARGNLTSAEAGLVSAQTNLAQLREGPSEFQIEVARQQWEQVKNQLWSMQIERDSLAGNSKTPQYSIQSATARALAGEAMVEIARLQYEQAKAAPSEYEIAVARIQVDQARGQVESAQGQVDQAQATLDNLTAGATSQEIAIAQVQVDQARIALDQAKSQLRGSVLAAPFAGTVTSVRANVGELVGPTSPAITLADLSRFHIEINIDESEIGQIDSGQAVIITLEAFRDWELTGRITSISPEASVQGGVIAYEVAVAVNPVDVPLRVGMTANATIVTAEKENALLVPNRAIQIDRDTGKMYVEKLSEESSTLVEIETGIRNDLTSEVVSGLEEGDRLVIRDVTSRERILRMMTLPGDE